MYAWARGQERQRIRMNDCDGRRGRFGACKGALYLFSALSRIILIDSSPSSDSDNSIGRSQQHRNAPRAPSLLFSLRSGFQPLRRNPRFLLQSRSLAFRKSCPACPLARGRRTISDDAEALPPLRGATARWMLARWNVSGKSEWDGNMYHAQA